MKKGIVFLLFWILAHFSLFLESAETAIVQRQVFENNTCVPSVSISITPLEFTDAYAVTEKLPPGLNPLAISENGQWHADLLEIRWGNFRDHTARTFTYQLTGVNADYLLDELVFSADGIVEEITSSTSISIHCTQTQNPEQPDDPQELPEQLPLPIFHLTSQTVPTSVDMTTTVQESVIYFTTDGSRPNTASQMFTGLLEINEPTILRAIAIKPGFADSEVLSIRLEAILTSKPTVNPHWCHVDSCAPSICFDITETVRSYALEIPVPQGLTPDGINENGQWLPEDRLIRWGNFKDGLARSLSCSLTGINGTYAFHDIIYSENGIPFDLTLTNLTLNCATNNPDTPDDPDPPEIIAAPIIHTISNSDPFAFSMTCSSPDTEIYYTTDGTRPTENSLVYANPISLTDGAIIRAIAMKDGTLSSDTTVMSYEITPTAPAFGQMYTLVDHNGSCQPEIHISLSPHSEIESWALELFLPENLNHTFINQSGIYSYTQHSIRWGNYRDNPPKEIVFSVTGYTQTAVVDGILSFDGHTQAMPGISVDVNCPNTNTRPQPPVMTFEQTDLELHYMTQTLFTVSDADSDFLTLVAFSSDPMLIPDSFIVLGDSPQIHHTSGNPGEPITLSLTCYRADKNYGQATITIEVYDGNGLSTSQQLNIAATPCQSLTGENCDITQTMGMVAAGDGHYLALKPNGTVMAWGNNSDGQLGIGESGSDSYRITPILINGLSNIIAIQAGSNHNLALGSDGAVWAWGDNLEGQLGIGNTSDQNTPVQINTLDNIVAIAAGFSHSLALKADGTVWAWGGQDEFGDHITIPVMKPDLFNVVAIAAGGGHSFALRSNGIAWAWGGNTFGQLGIGNTTAQNHPVKVHSISNIVKLAAGFDHSMALDQDGSVYAWGFNHLGQSGTANPSYYLTSPVQVSDIENGCDIECGSYHSFAQLNDGLVMGWGSNWNNQVNDSQALHLISPKPVHSITGIVDMSAFGDFSNIVLTQQGTILTWENSGHLPVFKEVMPNSEDIVDISSNDEKTCVVLNDGNVWCWGKNIDGLDTLFSSEPLHISGLTNMKAIVISPSTIQNIYHPVTSSQTVLKNDGTVWKWGVNEYGQLGNGTTENSSLPVQVKNLGNVISVSATYFHGLAVKSDGTVWSWGYNYDGQLGDGSMADRSVPEQIPYLDNVIQVAAGPNKSYALTREGTVFFWGKDDFRTSMTPERMDDLEDIVSIHSSDTFVLALKSDGTVWAKGMYDMYFYRIINLKDIVEIDIAGSNCMARASNGDIWVYWSYTWYPFYISLPDVSKIRAGTECYYFFKNDGSVWMWGFENSIIHPEKITLNPDKSAIFNVCSPIQLNAIDDQKIFEDTPITIPLSFTSETDTSYTIEVHANNPFMAAAQVIQTQNEYALHIEPYTNQNGQTKMVVVAQDIDGNATSTEFALTIDPVNDCPSISAIDKQVMISKNNAYTSPPFYIRDVDDDPFNLQLDVSSSNKALLSSDDIIIDLMYDTCHLIIPATTESGTTDIALTVTDISGLLAVSTFTLEIIYKEVSIEPIGHWYTDEDQPDSFSFRLLDTENDLSDLSIVISAACPDLISSLSYEKNIQDNLQTFSIIPSENQYGLCPVSITVTDAQLTLAESYMISIVSVDDPPEISQIPDQNISGTSLVSEIDFYVHDVDSNVSNIICTARSFNPIVVPENNIIIDGQGENRHLRIYPTTNAVERVVITVSAVSNHLTDTTTFAITFNSPPVVTDRSLTLDEDKHIYCSMTATDAQNDPLSYTIVEFPKHGTVTINGPIADYTPFPDYNGLDSFSFKANDGYSDSNIAMAVLTIYPINDIPVAQNLSFETAENMACPLYFAYSDVDGDILTPIINESPKHGNISQDLIYTPDDWFWGTDRLIYSLSDEHGTSLTATASITVNRSKAYTLSILSLNGVGEIEIDGTRILLPWQQSFAPDTEITIYPISTPDRIFNEWYYNQTALTDNPLMMTLDRDKSISAHFVPPTKVLTLLGYQSVTIDGVTYQLPLEKSFYQGDHITLNAVPQNLFMGWTGDICNNENPIEIDIQSNMTIGVTFKDSKEWALSINAETVDLPQTYTDSAVIGVSLLPETQAHQLPDEYGCSLWVYSSDWDKNKKSIQAYQSNTSSWVIAINPHGNIGSPAPRTSRIYWNPTQLSDLGNYRMYRGYDQTGEIVIPDMRTETEYHVTGSEAVQTFTIVWSAQAAITVHLDTDPGWNLISLPVKPVNTSANILFPDTTIYEYENGGYVHVTNLEPGKGYWLKTEGTGYDITGEPIGDYTHTLQPGWHLIGSLEQAVDQV
ncbi:MAG: hypothetical protein OMM_08528, partial [Candidatus Magnetoglobus multicellularis str. Araruama]